MASESSPPEGTDPVAALCTRPGRLGDSNMKLFQDPRAHPKLVEVFRAFGMDGSQGNPFGGASVQDLASTTQMAKNHASTMKLYEILPNDLVGDQQEQSQIHRETLTFPSFDGTERQMFVFRPAEQSRRVLPVVVYFHGGGMVLTSTSNKVHDRWCQSLAVQGVMAISVDFRNAYDNGKHNAFPIGLNDCAAAVQYIYQHKAELHISNIILQGESGGANLSLATALKAKREGWIHQIAGVYGIVPYISGAYGWPDARKLKELPSLYECEGYWLYTSMMAGMASYYCGEGEEGEKAKENPLAWPYFASIDDCKGLPPHVLAMDELDPLRDEGMAYYRKLLAAGVEAHAKVNLGVVHATSLVFRKLLPEFHNNAIRDVTSFAKNL